MNSSANHTAGNHESSNPGGIKKQKSKMSEVVPIYSPRSTYKKIKTTDEKMIADMTLNFDKLTINLLKEEFLKHGNGLLLDQFIVIAKKHLKFWQNDIPNREIALMRYLTFLFNEIDINGNGDMEWDEFTNYIIEKATVLKNLKSKADEIKHYVRSKVKPKIKIDGIIQKSAYISDMDKIAFYEEGSNRINFMNIDTGEISQKNINVDPKKLIVNISSVKKEKNGKVSIRKKDLQLETSVRVLDMIYLSEAKYKVLLVSTSDGYVRGWKHSQNGYYLANQPDNEEEPFQHYFPSEIYCMAWDHINEVLYCGQKNGNIYMWNLKTDLEKPLYDGNSSNYNNNKNSCFQGSNSQHENMSGNTSNNTPFNDKFQKEGAMEEKVNYMITSMITMPKLQFMASGRMDGKLILWDTINNKKKWVYSEHTRGILTLSFNQSMILLFSAGFDHKICIWNPYISTLIHRIEGHLAPILSLQVIEGTHQLVSVDTEGIVKITDTRRFNFIYSFSVEAGEDGSNSSSLSSLMVINKPLKLVFTGRSIYIYEYDKNYHPHTADENTAICCKYIKDKLSFFTPMGNKIKIWSSLNGDVERIYMDITPNQISTFQFDFLKKRMVVGDTKGNITLHNTANGAKMKTLSKHAGEVTHLIATQNDSNVDKVDIFISCGLDNEIRIFKETEQSYEIIRTIEIVKEVSINCLNYCPETKLIIVGSNVGTIAFYDIETGKTAGTCLNRSYEEFTSICRTKKSMIIASASSGKISVIAMPPMPNRFQKMFTFFHDDCEKNGSALGVRYVCYSDELQCLYLVDDKMYLTCYCFKQIEKGANLSKEIDEKVESVRRNMITKIFSSTQVEILWQVKVHQEVVKSLEFVEEELLLVTTSFDKKVKIWCAKSGVFLDSLQQNYNKSEPNPVAYYNTKSSTIFSPDLKYSKQVEQINPVKVQFDPFIFQNILKGDENFGKDIRSNHEWKIFVDFKEIAISEMEKFQKLAEHINEVQGDSSLHKMIASVKISEIKSKFLEQKKKLKVLIENNNASSLTNTPTTLNNNKSLQDERASHKSFTEKIELSHSPHKDKERERENKASGKEKDKRIKDETNNHTHNQKNNNNNKQMKQLYHNECLVLMDEGEDEKKTTKRYSKNYFRKNTLKCLESIIVKKQNQCLTHKNSLGKRRSQRDFVPISQLLKNRERTKEEAEYHQKYIDDLHKRATQSFINARQDQKLKLGKDESEATRKFFMMLNNFDSPYDEPKSNSKGHHQKIKSSPKNSHQESKFKIPRESKLPKLL